MLKKALTHTARAVLWVSFSCICLITVLFIAFGLWAGFFLDTSVAEELSLVGSDKTTRLYYIDENGNEQELTADRISGYENALFCPLAEMSPELKNAFVAIEDKRFYDHAGVDWARTLHAVLGYAGGGVRFGGSTITQQLVKNLTGDTEKSARRKITEILRAVDLEKKLSKEEILEKYLNIVNLAESCYGVRTAANAYFSKEPSELTLQEAATIAAITNNPVRYDPIRRPEDNRRRRDVILSEMLAQGMIKKEEYEAAIATATPLLVNKEALSGRVNSWYADLVVADVIRDLVREHQMSEAAASRLLYCGGLKIYTAINPHMQKILEEYYADPTHFPDHKNGKRAQSAMMVVDPQSGHILAVVGAVGEKGSNRLQSYATDIKRPSGSVIKPLSVYAPALERGLITYATVFDDVPLSYRKNGAPWPRNAPNIYRGLTTVNEALKQSVNTVSVSVLKRLGTATSFHYLKDLMGFDSLTAEDDGGIASLALGQQSKGVSLREVLGGFTALANQGVFSGTVSYLSVVDSDGETLLSAPQTERRVFSRETAGIMTLMLRRAVQQGTGKEVTLKRLVDVAGKTGTSGNHCDKWFVGYTPELLAGVWYGHEYPESLADVGGNTALTVWDEVMSEIVARHPPAERHLRITGDLVAVRYCKDSGKLPCPACLLDPRGGRLEIGYFKKGTEPNETCDRHVEVRCCRHGGVASECCPEEECYTVGLLRVERSFPCRIHVLDAPYTYVGSPAIYEPNFNNNEPYYAENGKTGQFYGIGEGVLPFNRSCLYHRADPFFWRRYLCAS